MQDNERRDLERVLEFADLMVIEYWNRACLTSDSKLRIEYLEKWLKYRAE